jgi:putative transposase
LPVDIAEFPATTYLLNCFNYIHLNPLEANLVKQLDDWPFSSWPDYRQCRYDGLCNLEIAMQLFSVSEIKTFTDSFVADERILKQIW